MKRNVALSPLFLLGLAVITLFFAGCSTINSRIEANRAAFDSLSPNDKQFVLQGKIRGGMSQESVYLAWGQPDQKAVGEVHGVPTETWVYVVTTTTGYGYPYGGFYGGFAGPVGFYGVHGGRRFYGAIYDPFYDPFYYPFPETISQPVKTVSFQRGRVIAFQYLASGY